MKIPDFLKGTNFWVSALLFFISFFGGTEELATQVVMSVAGLIAAFFAVRQFIQSAKFGGWKETLLSGEFLVTDITGPGEVYIQTKNIREMADWIWTLIEPRVQAKAR